MKTLILFLITLTILTTSCEKKPQTDPRQAYKDSLNGTYTEEIKINGVLDHFDFYVNYKLKAKGFVKNGQLYDLVQVDSVGNTLTHDPLLIWDNYYNFDTADSLKFKIKNVDSLTFYLYYYSTDRTTRDTKGPEALQNMNPIDSRESPVIMVSKKELGQNNKLYFLWGYLEERIEKGDTVTDTWNFRKEVFELNK